MTRPYSTTEGFAASQQRRVPMLVTLTFRLGSDRAFSAWFFLLFGIIVAALTLPTTDLTFGWAFRGELETVPAEVTAVSLTGMTENEGKIREVRYRYEDANGRVFQGVAYAKRQLEAGDRLTAEFPRGSPGVSRIQGLRVKPFSRWILVVLVLPAGGLASVGYACRRGGRSLRLLRKGVVADAEFVSRDPVTHLPSKNQVFRLRFRFVAAAGSEHICDVETSRAGQILDGGRQEILYDPEEPSRAAHVLSLPGDVGLSPANDSVLAPPLRRSLLCLLMPTVAIGVTVGILLWHAYH